MWQLHGNRVLETWFITLINKNKLERNHQNIREEPREKKKKNKKQTKKKKKQTNKQNKKKQKPETERERRLRSKSDRLQTQAVRDPGHSSPRLCANWVAWASGHTRPRPFDLGRATQAAPDLGRSTWAVPGRASLRPGFWVSRIDVFGISLIFLGGISACTWDLKFFKIFLG